MRPRLRSFTHRVASGLRDPTWRIFIFSSYQPLSRLLQKEIGNERLAAGGKAAGRKAFLTTALRLPHHGLDSIDSHRLGHGKNAVCLTFVRTAQPWGGLMALG